MEKVMENQSLVPLAQELLALEAETFEIRDLEETSDAMLNHSTTSSCTSSTTSTTSCSVV